jgi:hypothetical protein
LCELIHWSVTERALAETHREGSPTKYLSFFPILSPFLNTNSEKRRENTKRFLRTLYHHKPIWYVSIDILLPTIRPRAHTINSGNRKLNVDHEKLQIDILTFSP